MSKKGADIPMLQRFIRYVGPGNLLGCHPKNASKLVRLTEQHKISHQLFIALTKLV